MANTFRWFSPLVVLVSAQLCSAQALHPSTGDTIALLWDSTTLRATGDPKPWIFGRIDGKNDGGADEKPFQTGKATYYSARTHGRMMASGVRYDKEKLFCAHRTLPFGTMVRVVNKKNGREVVVEVLDRGPFAKGRIIDLSNKAAAEIGMLSDGVVPVELYIQK